MVRRFRAFEKEQIEVLHTRSARQYIVAVTGNVDVEGSSLSPTCDACFDAVCAKPMGIKELTNLVTNLLKSRSGKISSPCA